MSLEPLASAHDKLARSFRSQASAELSQYEAILSDRIPLSESPSASVVLSDRFLTTLPDRFALEIAPWVRIQSMAAPAGVACRWDAQPRGQLSSVGRAPLS